MELKRQKKAAQPGGNGSAAGSDDVSGCVCDNWNAGGCCSGCCAAVDVDVSPALESRKEIGKYFAVFLLRLLSPLR